MPKKVSKTEDQPIKMFVVELDGTVSLYVGSAIGTARAALKDGGVGMALTVTLPGTKGPSHFWHSRAVDGQSTSTFTYRVNSGVLSIIGRDDEPVFMYAVGGWTQAATADVRGRRVDDEGIELAEEARSAGNDPVVGAA